jgi:hypothetical protein
MLTSQSSEGGEGAKLRQHFRGEARGEETSQNAGANTQHAEHVAQAGSCLRGEAGDGADAENRGGKISSLDETSCTGAGRSEETSAKDGRWDGVEPGILGRISRA